MRASLSLAAALVTAVFGIAAVMFRLQETPDATSGSSILPTIHIGIQQTDAAFGLVSAPKEMLLDKAVSDLHLSADCARAARPIALADGMLLRFKQQGGVCTAAVYSLKGAARLISGLPLNINDDVTSGLELLPGIGPVKAQAIVDHRDKYGPFTNTEDLIQVHGIGIKTAEKLGPWVEFKTVQSGSK